MNGIWIRCEDGVVLVCAREVTLGSQDCKTWELYADVHPVAEYTTKEAAMRQLDDIQRWMQGDRDLGPEIRMMDLIFEEEGLQETIRVLPQVYDLRERKVKEGGQ